MLRAIFAVYMTRQEKWGGSHFSNHNSVQNFNMIEIPTFLAVRFKGSSWRGCGGSTRLKVAVSTSLHG